MREKDLKMAERDLQSALDHLRNLRLSEAMVQAKVAAHRLHVYINKDRGKDEPERRPFYGRSQST